MNKFDEQVPFGIQVRDHVAEILRRKYGTIRQGANALDQDEYRKERRFWPDMQFHEVGLSDGAAGQPVVEITFTPVYEQETTYGFLVDVDYAIDTWGTRVGVQHPRNYPSRFAAEIIWYMVTYIGSLKIEDCPVDHRGIRWINKGDDVFARLPDADEHHH